MIRRIAPLPLPYKPTRGPPRARRPTPPSAPSAPLPTTTASPSPKPPFTTTHPLLHRLFRLSLLTLKFSLLTHLFLTHIASLNGTTGPSMLPTIAVDGDWFLISKWRYRRGRNLRVGDVVNFRNPVIGGNSVKRVLGMPGDWVVRGTPAGREDGEGGEGGEGVVIQVPEGHCWVVGDNLPWSRDSRMFGPLPLALVKGKLIARYWPRARQGWIENSLQDVQD